MNKKRHRGRVVAFFENCAWLDESVLKPLSHIAGAWELTWQDRHRLYFDEEDSLASHLNDLIEEIAASAKPKSYHQFMDAHLFPRDDIMLKNGEWVHTDSTKKVSIEMLGHYISQQAIGDDVVRNLVLTAAGRIEMARKMGFKNFDDLDDNHMDMLSQVLMSILYARSSSPASNGMQLY